MKHITNLITLPLIIIFGSVALAQQPTKLEDPPWIKEVATQRIFYTVRGMEYIRPVKDVTYKRVAREELKMDVYQARNVPDTVRRPAVLFIHGGSLPSNLRTKPKEWGAYVSLGQLAAASGFVGITFNHRFYGWDMNSLSDARSDVAAAIDYIRDNAGRFGVDRDRIYLWSLSAGSLFLSPSLSDRPYYIMCLVFYYPIMDLEPLRKDRPVITDEVNMEFSPLARFKKTRLTLPPIYIARAGREEPALNTAVDTFIQSVVARKGNLDFSNHAEGRHGFDALDDNARTREIIKRTIEFMKAPR